MFLLQCPRPSTACPQDADRGHGLQTWKVDANIWNKQSRTGDTGWSSILDVGRGDNSSRRKLNMPPNGKESLGSEEILWNYRNDKGIKQRENLNSYLLTLTYI
jgi:hypothetical protein